MDYGALPKANIKAQKKFVAGFGNVDGTSTYADTFNGRGGIDFYRQQAEVKKQTLEYKRQQQRGTLMESSAPFKGESNAHREFKTPVMDTKVQKQLPFDMVSFPSSDFAVVRAPRRAQGGDSDIRGQESIH